MKELFRNSCKEVLQQDAHSEEVAEIIEEPSMLNDSRVSSQVLPQKEFGETTIEEATNLFDSKLRHPNNDSETMEIDVESDSELSNQDTKI